MCNNIGHRLTLATLSVCNTYEHSLITPRDLILESSFNYVGYRTLFYSIDIFTALVIKGVLPRTYATRSLRHTHDAQNLNSINLVHFPT